MNIFVNDADKIWQSFYVYQDKMTEEWHWGVDLDQVKENTIFDFVQCAPRKEDGSEVPIEDINAELANITEDDLQEIKVAFKKPNFGTALDILSESYQDLEVNAKLYTMARLGHLLVDWNITHEGEKVPVTPEFMLKINPNVMAGILYRLGTTVPHYRQL